MKSRVSNATVRMIARVTAAGEAVRIRLDNTYGAEPLEIGAAAVGQPMRGARLAPGSNRPVHFGGSASVTIPAGGRVTSDPVPLAVRAGRHPSERARLLRMGRSIPLDLFAP